MKEKTHEMYKKFPKWSQLSSVLATWLRCVIHVVVGVIVIDLSSPLRVESAPEYMLAESIQIIMVLASHSCPAAVSGFEVSE